MERQRVHSDEDRATRQMVDIVRSAELGAASTPTGRRQVGAWETMKLPFGIARLNSTGRDPSARLRNLAFECPIREMPRSLLGTGPNLPAVGDSWPFLAWTRRFS